MDGEPVVVADDGLTLLDVLREQLGVRSVKDGCSPQGQCGCCTVLVDGQPRVACVTPARRVAGRAVTTLDGLDADVRDGWARAFAATGGSQCGFCTPGIICRFAGLQAKGADHDDRDAAARALAAHLCRCTGWQPILDAWQAYPLVVAAMPTVAQPSQQSDRRPDDVPQPTESRQSRAGGRTDADALMTEGSGVEAGGRSGVDVRVVEGRDGQPGGGMDVDVRAVEGREVGGGVAGAGGRADVRASIEGRTSQSTGPYVALGAGGFADDTAPADALVAVRAGEGCEVADDDGWAVAETAAEARRLAGRVPGRRTTASWAPPLEAPAGDWVVTLRTSWVEPGYLETDAAWCEPGGEPVSPLGNGGAFGGKLDSPVAQAARRLADRHGRPVRVLWSRPDTVELGPKRPPMAAGVRSDGTGEVVVVRTPGVAEAIQGHAPGLAVTEVDVPGPPTSAKIRGAGWVEAAALLAAARDEVGWIAAPDGGSATARVQADGSISVEVRAGRPLDETVLRSYCTGAAHMAYSWVTSESLGVDRDGVVHDLTVRSFGIVGAAQMPAVRIDIVDDGAEPVNGSDAVFAAVAAAVWLARGKPPTWPTGR